MPFYAFHLDVPANVDVVSERVRAAVGRAPTLWETLTSSWTGFVVSGFPFVGRVKWASFRIRRDIQCRNPFQPRIRGSIVNTRTGSRVSVWMMMHPLAIAFLLVWVASLAFIQWLMRDRSVTESSLALGLLIFGPSLGVGSFFFEALKVKPLLAQAISNPAVVTAPPPVVAPVRTPIDRDRLGALAFRLVVLAIVLVMGSPLAVFYLYERRLRASPVFPLAIELVSRSPQATALLGTPVAPRAAARGQLEDDELGYAALTIPVQGPLARGTVQIVANRVRENWDVHRVLLEIDAPSGGTRTLDLTPPTQREEFFYPATGPVFLLPLDDEAAADVKDLPAYYRARLDLAVTLLPAWRPGTEAMDAASQQMIAEHALDAVEQAHPHIAEDVDAVLVAVTSADLKIYSTGWDYTTAYRRGRMAIASTAQLHRLPWYAAGNPAVYPVRVRKLVTKNVALLRYPVDQSTHPSSALRSWIVTGDEVDGMGERFGGEYDSRLSDAGGRPCLTIEQGPDGKQSWRLSCDGYPSPDNRFETFVTYPDVPSFVMSRTDFPLGGRRSFAFVRQYRSRDDRARAFGFGATDSFDIFPVGDSQTFSWIELILPDGRRIHCDRTTPGRSLGDAKFLARSFMGNQLSLSSLAFTSGGWTAVTTDGWTYQFPSSSPTQSWQRSALVGLRSPAGGAFTISRQGSGDLQRVKAPDGQSVEFAVDSMHRIISARHSNGHTVQYDYDAEGRLVHVQDSERGEEFYEYDPLNRLTAVLDARRRPRLLNTYGYSGDIRSQTLANGQKLLYHGVYNSSSGLVGLKLTLPNGYVIDWSLTSDGYSQSWPHAPES